MNVIGNIVDLGAVFIAGFVGAITPGPDVLLVLRNTLGFGVLAGLRVLFGISLGWILWLGIVYVGLENVLNSHIPQLALSVFGVLYLFHISYNIYKTLGDNTNINLESTYLDSTSLNTSQSFNALEKQALQKKENIPLHTTSHIVVAKPDTILKGFIVNISNPKAIIFFSIIVTRFIGDGLMLSLIVLFVSLASAFFVVIAMGAFFRRHINARIFLWIDRVCVVVFLVFGVLLALNALEIYQSF